MPASPPASAAHPEGSDPLGGGDRGHVPVLDGLRGAAILLVLLFHCAVLQARCAVDWVYYAFASSGWVGVDLFFVLSGYLITGILLDAKGSERYFRNFYARRALRIFPLYYAVVAFSFVALPRLLPPDKAARFGSVASDAIHYWLYLSNFAIARAQQFRHGVLDISWSLAIEEQFYLVWPAVVFFCSRRALARTALGLFAAALATRVVLRLGLGHTPHELYVLTPCRMDGLAVGALIAVLARDPGGLARLRRPARIAAIASGPLALATLLDEFRVNGGDNLSPGRTWPLGLVGYSLIAVFFGALLVLAVTAAPGSALARVLGSRLLRVFGTYSYGIYLFHMPVRALIRDLVFGPNWLRPRFRFPMILGSELVGQLLFDLIVFSLVLGLAWISFHVFEKRFLDLKRFFPTRRAAAAGSLSATRERTAA